MNIIGIIGAMDVEVELIKREMKQMSCERRLGMDFCAGTLGNTDVVWIAKAEAASASHALLQCDVLNLMDRFRSRSCPT